MSRLLSVVMSSWSWARSMTPKTPDKACVPCACPVPVSVPVCLCLIWSSWVCGHGLLTLLELELELLTALVYSRTLAHSHLLGWAGAADPDNAQPRPEKLWLHVLPALRDCPSISPLSLCFMLPAPIYPPPQID